MNLTVSLEMAKKLKKAGWRKETRFYWCVIRHYDGTLSHGALFIKSTCDIAKNPYRMVYDGHNSFCENQIAEKISLPTITELLEEMDNNTILQYENDVMVGLPVGDFIDLFRSPDNLAEVWLWAKREGLIK